VAVRLINLPGVAGFDRARQIALVDWLAVAFAVSLPWSTTITSVLAVVWLIAVLPTVEVPAFRRDLVTAAALLPVLLWLLAAAGTLWADVSFAERWSGLDRFDRLLFVPLLLLHFRCSERGSLVLGGFVLSTLGVLLLSWLSVLTAFSPWRTDTVGVPVKEYISQSTEFLACAFGLLVCAMQAGRWRRWPLAAALIAVALLFLADIFFVVTSRATLVAALALLLLLAWREFGWRGVVGAFAVGGVVATAIWFASPYMRTRLTTSVAEFQDYRDRNAYNSTALHLEFLRDSMRFVETAPVIGHGTGTLPQLFRNAAAGHTGASGAAWGMPHNQFFGVAVQIGLVGAAVLIAMWVAHFLLFTGRGLAASVGAVVVVQNVVSSLTDTALFSFNPGWLYVFGVGVAGGMVWRLRDLASEDRTIKPVS
jgi:O-antigen ligase